MGNDEHRAAFEAWAKSRGLKRAALSRSGFYQRKRLDRFCRGRGYRETSVIYMREF
jgi:hypothetical protein